MVLIDFTVKMFAMRLIVFLKWAKYCKVGVRVESVFEVSQ